MSNLLDNLKKDARKDDLMSKMAKIPSHATHVGVANIPDMGVTVVVTSAMSTPSVFDPQERRWVQLVTKIG